MTPAPVDVAAVREAAERELTAIDAALDAANVWKLNDGEPIPRLRRVAIMGEQRDFLRTQRDEAYARENALRDTLNTRNTEIESLRARVAELEATLSTLTVGAKP